MSDLNAFPIKSRAFPRIAGLRAYIVDPAKDPKMRHRGDQGPGAAGRAPADQGRHHGTLVRPEAISQRVSIPRGLTRAHWKALVEAHTIVQ
jgi:hypothetical protein